MIRVLFVCQVNKCLPFITVTQMQTVSVKVEFVLVMVSLQCIHKFSAVKPAHGILWEKVALCAASTNCPDEVSPPPESMV